MEKKPVAKTVGKITPAERDAIKWLFERKNGLTELAKCLDNPSTPLYEKLVADMGETTVKFQKWWDDASRKYQWESKEGWHWEINFETCDIYLHP
jgi:CXXX repeat modification system protein